MTSAIVIIALISVCLVAAVLALRSTLDILINGSGFGCIVREKSKDAALFLSSISVIALCLCYLAITDILKDYAGYMLILPDGQSVQSVLPYWAKCELEWRWVLRGGLVLVFSQLAMLVIMVKSRANQSQKVPASPIWVE